MKKGQAAMEFIMTYGWAILAVLVSIGALSYFGVINPSKYFPEKCLFASGINCKDFRAYEHINGANKDLIVQITLENKLQEAVNIQNITMHAKSNSCTNNDCVNTTCIPVQIFTQDDPLRLNCTLLSGSPGVGQKAIISATITYNGIQGGFNHPINGDIQANVQAE